MLFRPMLAASALALALTLSIANAAAEKPVSVPAAEIVSEQTHLRAKVVAKEGAFKDMYESDREQLIKKQDRLLELLAGRNDINQLNADERIELYNTLQLVNGIVAKAEDDRKICERTRAVGSNRFQLACITAKQQRENRDNAKSALAKAQNCTGGPGICKTSEIITRGSGL